MNWYSTHLKYEGIEKLVKDIREQADLPALQKVKKKENWKKIRGNWDKLKGSLGGLK